MRREIYVTYVERVTEKFIKQLTGKDEISAALERLDRLTKDEGLAVAAQSFDVVHGIASAGVVMGGAPYLREFSQTFI